MDVTVIVITHNQTLTLKWLLASLANQDYRGTWEVVVTDDGSWEQTREVLNQAAKCDVRYVWQPHCAPRMSRARNNGIRLAQGDLLVFLDADIVVGPDFLSRHVSLHVRDKLVVCGRRSWVFLNGETFDSLSIGEVLHRLDTLSEEVDGPLQLALAASPQPWRAVISCNFSVRRVDAVAFDEAFAGWGLEDRELACRLVTRHGYQARHSPLLRGYHVMKGSREQWMKVKPLRSHEEISRYMLSLEYFAMLYPDVDLSFLNQNIRAFARSEETQQWAVTSGSGSDA